MKKGSLYKIATRFQAGTSDRALNVRPHCRRRVIFYASQLSMEKFFAIPVFRPPGFALPGYTTDFHVDSRPCKFRIATSSNPSGSD